MVGALLALPALAERPRVVVIGVSASNEKLKQVGATIAEQILTELGRTERVEAMGASDVQAVLGLERQKQVLGCTEASSSCLAEISSALGAPWLVSGTLGQLGKAMRLDLKLIRVRDGKAVFRDGKVLKDESEVFDAVTEMAKQMVKKMDLPPEAPKPVAAAVEPAPKPARDAPALTPVPAAPAPSTPALVAAPSPQEAGPRGVGPWVVAGGGAVAAVAGGLLVGWGLSTRSAALARVGTANAPIPPGTEVPTVEETRTALTTANTVMWTGGVVAGVGVLAVGGGLFWRFGPGSGESKASVTLVPGPGSLAVQGAF